MRLTQSAARVGVCLLEAFFVLFIGDLPTDESCALLFPPGDNDFAVFAFFDLYRQISVGVTDGTPVIEGQLPSREMRGDFSASSLSDVGNDVFTFANLPRRRFLVFRLRGYTRSVSHDKHR